MEFAIVILAISIMFYSYAIHLRRKASKKEVFDKHGRLTGQGHIAIQRGVRENNTLS